jgi:hypothetical protein
VNHCLLQLRHRAGIGGVCCAVREPETRAIELSEVFVGLLVLLLPMQEPSGWPAILAGTCADSSAGPTSCSRAHELWVPRATSWLCTAASPGVAGGARQLY